MNDPAITNLMARKALDDIAAMQEYMDFELGLFERLRAMNADKPRPEGNPVTVSIPVIGSISK